MIIGSLSGKLIERSLGGEVIVEVNGVGYRLTVTPATALLLGEIGDDVFIHVHHHIRDDAQMLYGFPSLDERVSFEALISAHGVGPALGLAILSVHRPAELRRVLADDDIAALCLVPGVGKKTAARLLVELKSRLDLPDVDIRGLTTDAAPQVPSVLGDVREALAGLGYGPDEIRTALSGVEADGDPALLLKDALKILSGAR